MAGWNHKNCCCEPRLPCDGDVNICCMTLELSTWARELTLYAVNTDPDDLCGYTTTGYSHNNRCGYVVMLRTCGSYPVFPRAEIVWGIQSDGTVKLILDIFSTVDGSENYVGPVHHEVTGLDPDTWYLSPVVFTLSGVTYTIEVCPDPHEPFPEWPLTDVYLGAVVTDGPTVHSQGNLVCGVLCPDSAAAGTGLDLRWRYSVYTDKVRIKVTYVTRVEGVVPLVQYNGSVLVDYDNGNWASDTHTITMSASVGGPLTVTVSPVASCVIVPPPPPCDVSNACFPDGCPCIIDGSDGSLYRDLVADVSGPVTYTGLTLAVNGNGDGWEYNAGPDSLVIQCTNGGLDPYYVAAVFGGVNYFFSIPAGGIDCDPDDTNQILDITLTDGTITIRIYTI